MALICTSSILYYWYIYTTPMSVNSYTDVKMVRHILYVSYKKVCCFCNFVHILLIAQRVYKLCAELQKIDLWYSIYHSSHLPNSCGEILRRTSCYLPWPRPYSLARVEITPKVLINSIVGSMIITTMTTNEISLRRSP